MFATHCCPLSNVGVYPKMECAWLAQIYSIPTYSILGASSLRYLIQQFLQILFTPLPGTRLVVSGSECTDWWSLVLNVLTTPMMPLKKAYLTVVYQV